jgi:hypothetical protein
MNFLVKQDRRQQPRAECNLTAMIHTASRSFNGLIRNVSDNGVFLCSSQKLLAGECIRITVEPTDCAPLVFDAEVVWSHILRHNEPGGLYAMGCRLIDVCLMQNMAVLPGVLGCRPLRRTVQVRKPIPRYRGTSCQVARPSSQSRDSNS